MISTIYHFEFPATALSQLDASIFQIDQSRCLVKVKRQENTAVAPPLMPETFLA